MATLVLENRILTLTNDDDTTSSVDLATVRGDMGVRGPQGPAGGADTDLSNYYTKEEVNALIQAAIPASGDEVKY